MLRSSMPPTRRQQQHQELNAVELLLLTSRRRPQKPLKRNELHSGVEPNSGWTLRYGRSAKASPSTQAHGSTAFSNIVVCEDCVADGDFQSAEINYGASKSTSSVKAQYNSTHYQLWEKLVRMEAGGGPAGAKMTARSLQTCGP